VELRQLQLAKPVSWRTELETTALQCSSSDAAQNKSFLSKKSLAWFLTQDADG